MDTRSFVIVIHFLIANHSDYEKNLNINEVPIHIVFLIMCMLNGLLDRGFCVILI